jgi:triphosphoribosyl-dephospho-CoA synthase
MSPINIDFSCPMPDGAEDPQIISLIARCAQLAMLLEVSASPKPGNIDREHNYPDTCFEHFIASSVSVYPTIEMAARSKSGIGALFRSAVCESSAWQQGGNTHFGAFLLLIPLSMAAGELLHSSGKVRCELSPEKFEDLASRAYFFVRATDCEDAVEFYRAFDMAGVRVNSVDEFSLEDLKSTAELRGQKVTLYELMGMAEGYDMIAGEWVSGFGCCLEGANSITKFMQSRSSGVEYSVLNCSGSDINEAIVYTFLKLLSRHRDTFIQTKFDKATADYVSSRACDLLLAYEKPSDNGIIDFASMLPAVKEFDIELLKKRINPGSTADIVIAGIFIALLGGLRF